MDPRTQLEKLKAARSGLERMGELVDALAEALAPAASAIAGAIRQTQASLSAAIAPMLRSELQRQAYQALRRVRLDSLKGSLDAPPVLLRVEVLEHGFSIRVAFHVVHDAPESVPPSAWAEAQGRLARELAPGLSSSLAILAEMVPVPSAEAAQWLLEQEDLPCP